MDEPLFFGELGRVATSAEQRTIGGVTLPLVVQCASPAVDVPAVAAWVAEHQPTIEKALAAHGAVLFRSFPMRTAEDFDAFVSAFRGWEDLSYTRSMSFAVRKRCTHRICTTNEGKSGGLIFHHEQAQTPLWPSRVFFCCEQPAAPGDGGGTGLVSSHFVLEELKRAHPAFVQKCNDVGVRYTVFAGPAQDASKGAGRSWKSFFHAETKAECEAKMARGGWEWEWGRGPNGAELAPDFLKCVTPRLDAVKTAPGTTRECFFNQLIATIANALEFGRVGQDGGGFDPLVDTPTQEAVDECVRFADGSRVELHVLLDAKRLCEQHAVDVQWQVRARLGRHNTRQREAPTCTTPLPVPYPPPPSFFSFFFFPSHPTPGRAPALCPLDCARTRARAHVTRPGAPLADALSRARAPPPPARRRKAGDVALICNYQVMHARRPWSGPAGSRKVLASLVAEQHCTSAGRALVV